MIDCRSTSCVISARSSSSFRSCCHGEVFYGLATSRPSVLAGLLLRPYLCILTQRIEASTNVIGVVNEAEEVRSQGVVGGA